MSKKKSSFSWWQSTTSAPSIWKKITFGVLAIICCFFVYFSVTSGPNGDDLWQNHYADHILDYYATFGEDTTVLYHRQGPIKYYGGLYEFSTAVVNESLGYENMDRGYHIVRHLINSLFALVAILSMVYLTLRLVNWRAAAIVSLIFLCSPVFLHHGAINPKDIPFAAGFGLSLLAMWNWWREWPDPSWRSTIFLGLAIGSALAIRIGGLILFGFLVLFSLILLYHFIRFKNEKAKLLWKILKHGVVASVIAYFICVIFWPYALQDPINNPWTSFVKFNDLQIAISVLFQGENIMSDSTSMWYVPIWMYKTIPVVCLIGFVLSIVFIRSLIKRIGLFGYAFLMFTVLFPIFYLVIQNSTVHDGWRHSTFVYLPLVAISGIAIDTIWNKYMPFGKKAYYIMPVILVLLSVHPILHMLRYPEYAYVHFNILNNQPSQVNGYFETDYWGLSVEEAVEWMEDEGILYQDMEPITIASHMYYGLRVALRSRGYDKEEVKTEYVRYPERFDKKWDYAIYPARYVAADQLRAGTYPGTYAIKTFYVDGSPVCAILKSDDRQLYSKGKNALNSGNTQDGVKLLKQEIDNHPDNLMAIRKLSNYYLQNQQYQDLQDILPAYKKASPDSDIPYLYDGLMNLNQGKTRQALQNLDKAIELNPRSYQAMYYKAMVFSRSNRTNDAISLLEQVTKINPRFKPAYQLLSQIYNQMGDQRRARRYKQMSKQL